MTKQILTTFQKRIAFAVTVLMTGVGFLMKAEAADLTGVATPDEPAVVSINPNDNSKPAGSKGGSVIVSVVGFHPPPKGSVQAVVSVETELTGESKEIGRFGLFPNSGFNASDGADTQRFRINLDQAATQLVRQEGKVSVGLVPFGGSGDGARLDIGKIDLLEK